MLLSDLIVLGSTLRPQVKRSLFADGGSCALGAALEALGLASSTAEVSCLERQQHMSWSRVLAGPDDYFGARSVIISQIGQLNDSGWTRESIAQWLRAYGLDFDVPVRAAPVAEMVPEEVVTCV